MLVLFLRKEIVKAFQGISLLGLRYALSIYEKLYPGLETSLRWSIHPYQITKINSLAWATLNADSSLVYNDNPISRQYILEEHFDLCAKWNNLQSNFTEYKLIRIS